MKHFNTVMQLAFSYKKALLGLVAVLCTTCAAWAQTTPRKSEDPKDKRLIQLSGMIKSAETNVPVPFTTVRIKSTYRGTIAGLDGFYSFAVGEKDTVEFVATGFKTSRFIVPGNLSDQKFTYHPELETDTFKIYLDNMLSPYATTEEFKQAFVNLRLNDEYAELARKNMDPQKLAELYETLARDGNENQIYTLQQIAASYYYAGGQRNYIMMWNAGSVPVPASLLNPFAWAEFIKDIRSGKFKKKKK